MAVRISSIRDLETWAAQDPTLDDDQAQRVARALWDRDDFPHPVNNTDISDYLDELNATLGEGWLYEMAGQ